MPEHPARFLILRGGALGDFLLTLPALAGLRSAWPKATIELAGYPYIAEIGRAGGLVDRIVSLDQAGMARLFGRPGDLHPDLVEYIRSFDVVVSYLYDPDDLVKDNLQVAGARQVLCGSPVVGSGHAVDWYAAPLGRLAVFPEPEFKLRIPDDLQGRARIWLKDRGLTKPVLIHPGSGSPKKNWPLENFLEVARRLRKAGRDVVFTAGEADAELPDPIRRAGWPVAEAFSLVDLAALLQNGSGFVGNDSGVSHLASAVGLPGVALFGPTDPDMWAPRNLTPLRSPDLEMAGLSIDEVWSVWQRKYAG